MLLKGSTCEKDVKIALDRLHQAKFSYFLMNVVKA
jgi:hypothetical protein